MTTIHHTPPPGATPFAIYEDSEDLEPPSPSEVYEGDVSFTSDMSFSGADVAIPTVESEDDLQEEPEPYNGSYTSRPPSILSSSRRGSAITANSFVSSLPSEISVASKPVPPANALESRYSPRKERPPFRNPSSVRAMQMASPPPLLAPDASRERMKGSYKLATPSRSGRSDSVSTTGRRRSRSHRDSIQRDIQAHSPRPTATPQPLPLVLLHVSILPMQMPYAPEVMIKIMPEWLVENYKVLEDKLQDIVLMRRGLLIQHPRDEYDVLEERILESLELKTPRILKCGHFVAPDSDDEEAHGDDEEPHGVIDDGTGRGSRMSGGTITGEGDPEFRYPTPNSDDASVCMDCHRQVKKPGHGVGAGTKRWDIKIYAANGLMRAGAWAAAWSEMERCDVEISPWIPNEVRKTLDRRLEQEQEAAKVKALYAAELQRQIEEEAAAQKKLEEETEAEKTTKEAELQKKIEAEAAALQRKLEEEAAEKRQLEATLNEKIEEAKEAIRLEFEAQALSEANCVAERFRAMEDALKMERERAAAQAPPIIQPSRDTSHSRDRSRRRHRSRSRSRRSRMEDIPLGTLLKNYLVLQLQDSRNFLILILGALLAFLLTNMNRPTLDLAVGVPLNELEPIVPAVLTSMATMTEISFSTLVVTEVRTLDHVQETLSPAGDATATIKAGLEEENDAFSTSYDTARTSALPQGPSGQDSSTSLSVKTLSESTESLETVTSTTEAPAATDVSTSTESASSLSAVEEPIAETSTTEILSAPIESGSPTEELVVSTESVTPSEADEEPKPDAFMTEELDTPLESIPPQEELVAPSNAVEEPSAEPFLTEELEVPLQSASPADVPNEEEQAFTEAQAVDSQETETLQFGNDPTFAEDASSTEHERDEL